MSTAPKVTIEQVEDAIRGETYTVLPDGRTTICQLTLDNGFTVDGHSACVSIENFNAELGNKYSREEAVKKVWNHLGFRLADQLMSERGSFIDRLEHEWSQLGMRLHKLRQFINESPVYQSLSSSEKELLLDQQSLMEKYLNVLSERIGIAEKKN